MIPGKDWERSVGLPKACEDMIIRKFIEDADAFGHPDNHSNCPAFEPRVNAATVLKKAQR
jgi:hypothetical protein